MEDIVFIRLILILFLIARKRCIITGIFFIRVRQDQFLFCDLSRIGFNLRRIIKRSQRNWFTFLLIRFENSHIKYTDCRYCVSIHISDCRSHFWFFINRLKKRLRNICFHIRNVYNDIITIRDKISHRCYLLLWNCILYSYLRYIWPYIILVK